MRRKLFFALLILLATLVPLASHAQTVTIVSATIVDPQGIPYANANITAIVVPPNGGVSPYVTATASPLIVPFYAHTDQNGAFSMGLFANASVTPASTHYSFNVNLSPGELLPFGTGGQNFTVTGITVSGATQNISANLNAVAPPLTHLLNGGNVTVTAVASYIVKQSDNLILANGADNQGIVLPAPAVTPIGKTFTIKMDVGTFTTGPVNVTATGGAAIDKWSGGNYQICFVTSHCVPTTVSTGGSVTVRNDGTQYWIVAAI